MSGNGRHFEMEGVLRGALAVSALLALGSGVLWASPPLQPWRMRADMAVPATTFGSTAVGGMAYAIGGQAPGPYGNDVVQRYDPVSNTWTQVAPMPTARHSVSAAVVDGKIYAIGGHVYNSMSTNEMYDPDANQWFPKASKPTAVSSPGVAAFGGKIYAFGGNRYGTMQSVIEVYDPNTNAWQSAGNMPEAGEPWDAVTLGDRIYLAGGNGFPSEPDRADHLWSYDPNTGQWDTTLPRLNIARAYPVLVGVNDTLFAIGGSGDSGPLSSVESWSPGDANWTLCESLNVSRWAHGAAAIGQTIYAFGGVHDAGNLASTESAVPEPAMLALLAASVPVLLKRKSKRT